MNKIAFAIGAALCAAGSFGADLDLNGEWEFRFEEGKALEEVLKPDFAATEKMSVPGCFDALAKYRYRRGTGLYRRTFTLEKAVDRAYLVVEGMGLRGEFLVDGKSLGVHPYPYARLELPTGPLAAGEHTLVAAIDNRLDWKTVKLARVYYDFYFFGGFYRGVRLAFSDGKVFVRTRDYRTGLVELEYRDGTYDVAFDGGKSSPVAFANGRATVKVPDFKLWSPEHPNLHTVTVDGVTTRFGIREVKAADRRIWLNGEPVFLKGVNRHEQCRETGATTTREMMTKDLGILKGLGANFVRGAHYQQDPRFLDLCDEMGFFVWEESLGWGNGQDYTKLGSTEELKDPDFIAQQIRETGEMVKASFNHPCVIIAAFLNECGSDKPECKALVDRLVKTIRDLDSGRLVTFACNHNGGDDLCHENTDLIAFNAYPGTIPANPGTKEELRRFVEKDFNGIVKRFRAKYPDKPIMVSESGCSGFYGMRDETAPFGCEDFQNEYLTDIFETLWANPDVVGFSIWQFADTVTHQRNCGRWSGRNFGISMAGIVSADRRPKLSCETVKRFFARKAAAEE